MSILNLYKYRTAWVVVSILLASLLGAAYYLQFHQDLAPCEYCIYQRIIIISMLAVTIVVSVFFNSLNKIGLYLMASGSLAMSLVSGRHAYIQRNPEASTCEESSKSLIDVTQINFMQEESFFKGYGDCSKRVFELAGLSIPEILLVIFGVAFVLALLNVYGSLRK